MFTVKSPESHPIQSYVTQIQSYVANVKSMINSVGKIKFWVSVH